MNKKEQAAFDKAQADLAAAYALSWPTEPEPQPMTQPELHEEAKKSASGLFVGWWINDYSILSRGSIGQGFGQGCSNGHNHCRSYIHKTTTQNCGTFYRSKREAILALRWQVCRFVAGQLAKLDAERNKE